MHREPRIVTGPTVIPAASAHVSERLSAKFDRVAMWSGQTADRLGAQVSERLSVKFDQAAVWSGQIMEKLSVQADAVSVKAAETALWSEQMIDSLTAGFGLQWRATPR